MFSLFGRREDRVHKAIAMRRNESVPDKSHWLLEGGTINVTVNAHAFAFKRSNHFVLFCDAQRALHRNGLRDHIKNDALLVG